MGPHFPFFRALSDLSDPKKRVEIVSACVRPAVAQKIVFTPAPGGPKNVKKWLSQQRCQLSFDLVASKVAVEVEKEGVKQWVECSGSRQVSKLRVQLYLCQLSHYLEQGFSALGQLPLGHARVVIHLGECGPCCCPWHMKQGSMSDNVQRSREFKRLKGSNSQHIHYA